MASLKDLRNRIRSVQSTRKITSAMKVVAASRLKRAQDAAEASRPYAVRMERMLASLAQSMAGLPTAPPLLAGTGKSDTHLVIIATSDRGLAGGFNAVILREARRQIRALQAEGKTVKIMTIGRKGRDAIKREFPKLLIDSVTDIGRKGVHFSEAKSVSEAVLTRFTAGEFDVATIIFAKFKSAISQIVTVQQLIPFGAPVAAADPADEVAGAIYEFEPSEEEILAELLPNNVGIQIFTALLENAASEHGSRMTAMDNATRNAGDMIKGLTLVYNRTRQATITKELIEIISGAEAL
ncbi:MAG TPA: F0F1 ATP synthase subunit gamma [Aliidongia sp.]|uniref:F0F1 ATP synthase subunit gamma n=1 Tax=Aliidongia sp. TaxID=1914230 RepID=UPI002DDCF7C3|nr:F0F1 ATP synthase subunit gamma [Aliidongia sp.]HEV2677846.1 F0F1 ATP synthase subunit gamma [Aliidongia sp.]